jgi:hypothetical protein
VYHSLDARTLELQDLLDVAASMTVVPVPTPQGATPTAGTPVSVVPTSAASTSSAP